MRVLRIASSVCVAALVGQFVAGCAGVTFQKEVDAANDRGIRYYEPAPFLLIKSDSKGGLTSEIIWLPDTTRVMTLKPYAYLAKNDSTFKFEQGVLTQAKSVADETAIPSAIVSALKTAAVAAISAANRAEADPDPSVPAPYLYRIVVTKDGATLYSADRDPKEIKVTLTQPAKKN